MLVAVNHKMKNRDNRNAVESSRKTRGRIYTPPFIVGLMLDRMGYKRPQDILCRHIIDNSCGDGAFLTEIVRRYCRAYLSTSPQPEIEELAAQLAAYVHGIEIDETECQSCVRNLNGVAREFGLEQVEWDVTCGDTLTVSRFDGRMDYVVGNPPYVRVHNLSGSYDAVKRYEFAVHGMTDLYIVFFEIGFKMLSGVGRMCLITPSSWLGSKAGDMLRTHIRSTRQMYSLVDLGHFQAFQNVTTYTIISQFDKRRHQSISYSTLDADGVKLQAAQLVYSDFVIGDQFFLADKTVLNSLRAIRLNTTRRDIRVKNGFATLADSVFIGDFDFTRHTIRVVKASTGQWTRCIFPYDSKGKLIAEEELKADKRLYSYLLKHKARLTRGRDRDNSEWYAFGRTQAILDVARHKYAINSLVKDIDSIKLVEVAAGEGVYSGLYILTELTREQLSQIIMTDDFMRYIRALKNYKSGGYYTFSSKDLELYLNHKLQEHDEQR